MISYDDLFYGNLSSGQLDGYCAVTLELGKEKRTNIKPLISTILTFGRTKIFRVMGDFKHTPGEDLFTLLSILRENNYLTVAVLDGQKKEEWMEQITYRIINITEEPWLAYAAQELHYQPMKKEDLELPILQDIHLKSFCYLDVNRDLIPAVVFDFIKLFPQWRIFSLPSKNYRMTIPIKEED
jgi:hypothetical protein